MKNLDRLSKKKIGDILVDEKLCTRDQVDAARAHQENAKSYAPLGEILLDMNTDLTEGDIARAISTQFQFPCLYAANYKVLPEAVELISRPLLYESLFIPVDIIGNTVLIVMGGLITAEIVTQIESETGKEVFIYVSTRSDVLAALQTHAPFDVNAPEASDAEGDNFDWEKMFDEADQELLAEE